MAERILKGGEYLVTEVMKDEVFTPEDFTNEQKEIAETAEQFVLKEVKPDIDEIDRQNFDLMVERLKKCGELGLFMIDAPKEYGGLELNKTASILAAEKMGAAGSFSVAYSCHTSIGTLPLMYYGTRELKNKYLKKLISGEWLGAFCLTEPDAGSDVFSGKTTALLSDDGKTYILNGTKQFITNGSFADIFTVFAKTDPKHFTAFLVERGFAGLSIGSEENKMGIKGSSNTQVIFENARVPVENVLGEIGRGHKVALNILNIGRLKLGAAVTGTAKDALGEGIRYANKRKQFGKAISSFGAVKEKLADMTANIFASESLVYRLSGMMDEKLESIEKDTENYDEKYQKGIEAYSLECGIAKVFCSDVLAHVADEVVQIFGGYGYISDYPAERFYRDERINRIFEGTNEINRLVVIGLILRKAMKGELPLRSEAMKAFEDLMTPSFEEIDESIPFAKEKLLVKNLKTLFLLLAGAAAQKYGDRLQYEQEILLAAADMAIQIFAIESAVLRVEKAYAGADERKKELMKTAVQVFSFAAAEKTAVAAKKTAFYVEEGDTLAMILSGVRRFTKYDATGLLQAKRALADAVIEEEKYIF